MSSTKAISGELLARLMRFAVLLQNLAGRFTGLVRFLTLSGLLSALILDVAAARSWGLGGISATLLGVFMMLPGALLGWCWYALDLAVGLPQRLASWTGQAASYAGDVRQRLQEDGTGEKGRARLSDLRQLGGLAYEMASMGMDAGGLAAIFGGSLALANPVFLGALAIAAGLILLLDSVAFIAILVILF